MYIKINCIIYWYYRNDGVCVLIIIDVVYWIWMEIIMYIMMLLFLGWWGLWFGDWVGWGYLWFGGFRLVFIYLCKLFVYEFVLRMYVSILLVLKIEYYI